MKLLIEYLCWMAFIVLSMYFLDWMLDVAILYP
jgi:hypothetical protein